MGVAGFACDSELAKNTALTVAALICFQSRLYLSVYDIGDISGGVVLGGLTLWLWYQLSSSDKLENAFQN